MATTNVKKTVLVIGGTGSLGKRVVRELLKRGHAVRALVRPSSDASALEAQGVSIARGDMNKAETLAAAFAGADAVVSTANGYMRRKAGDTIDTDYLGNRNLVDAAAAAKTKLFVFCSALACDIAPTVPHFEAKRIVEAYIREKNVPFIIVRPGGFFDREVFEADLTAGRVSAVFNTKVAVSWIHPDTVARCLAAAVDAPTQAIGKTIDLGTTKPATMEEVAAVAAKLLGRPISIRYVPRFVLWCVSWFSPLVDDLLHMFDFFNEGKFVANTALQAEFLGPVPTIEDTVHDLLVEAKLLKD